MKLRKVAGALSLLAQQVSSAKDAAPRGVGPECKHNSEHCNTICMMSSALGLLLPLAYTVH